jgi:cell division protein FtsA
MIENAVTILDAGGSKIAILTASLGNGGVMNIHALATVPARGIKRGQVVDIHDLGRAVGNAVKHLKQELAVDELGPVVALISGAHVEGALVQGFKPIIPSNRAVTNQDVYEVVKHSRSGSVPPDRDHVQAVPRAFRIDGGKPMQNPVGKTGSRLEVTTYLATGQKSAIQSFLQAMDISQLEIAQFVYTPLASGIGALQSDEMEQGALVLDIGASKTDLAIFSEGSMAYATTIGVGGNSVTQDLVQLISVSEQEAERLKLGFGAALSSNVNVNEAVEVTQQGHATPRPMQRKVLCEIIESRMRELAKLAHRQAEKSGFATVIKSVVITGGGVHLPLTRELFQEVFTGKQVRVTEPKMGKGEFTGLAAAVGGAQFVLQTNESLTTISSEASWQDRIAGLWSMLSGK